MSETELKEIMGDYSQELIERKLNDITSSSSYFLILTIFAILETSIHLSRIAKLIGKSKSTTLSHIDNLLKDDHPVIEIDAERTVSTRGSKKFYKLSEFGTTLMKYQNFRFKTGQEGIQIDEEQIEQFESRDQFLAMVKEESKGLIEKYGEETVYNYLSLGGELNRNIMRIGANQYLDMAMGFYHDKKFDESKITLGTFHQDIRTIKVAKLRHILKLKNTFLDIAKQLKDLETEILDDIENELKKGNIQEDDINIQHIFMSLTPIFKE
ncbi:MAG: hypothetical protein ACXAB7_04790 [Candidatus Kariarchaeaceae archaeon]|jgi:hypothetical protein